MMKIKTLSIQAQLQHKYTADGDFSA